MQRFSYIYARKEKPIARNEKLRLHILFNFAP